MKKNYYTNISKLPLKNFVTCLVDGDRSALVIDADGEPVDAKVLEDAWGDIQDQYATAIQDLEWKLYISLLKETYCLTVKIQMIELLVSTLRNFYDEKGIFARELNKVLGTKCKFNYQDTASHNADLDKCLSRGKGFAIQLDLKLIALRKLEDKITKNKKADETYFQSMLNVLEEVYKTSIDETTITVYRFADRLRRLEKQIRFNVKRRFY